MTATRTIISRALICLFGLVLPATLMAAGHAGALARYSLRVDSLTQWRLPDRLNEISGLALNDDGRLFAVDDELAVVYELDIEAGRIRKSFSFGNPPLRADFEGIAVVRQRIYLLTSDGVIVSGAEGRDGEPMAFMRHDSGLGENCELEGLAQQPVQNRLLLACKKARRGGNTDGLKIFSWSIAQRALVPAATVDVPIIAILRRLDENRFNPSGIAVDPASGHLLLVAARQRALVELDAEGRLLEVGSLASARHRQPEGIEMTRDGKLLIADEGGNHKARLGIYFPDRRRDTSQQ